MTTVFKRDDVRQACLLYGSKLNLTGLVDSNNIQLVGSKVLWAISGEESSFGDDCGPRFEPSYWDGEDSKSELQTRLNALYNKDAAMSYGPWQLMYANFVQYTYSQVAIEPSDLSTNIQLNAMAAINFLNKYVIDGEKALNLFDIARIFNSGNKISRLTPGVDLYIEKVTAFYMSAPLGD